MNTLAQFALYNLLPSIIVGLVAWVIVMIALRFLPIYDAKLRLSFWGAPVIKSALVLLGIGVILPWPQPFFNDLQSRALSPQELLPVLLVWALVLLVAYALFVQRLRRKLLQHAYFAPDLAPRLEQSLRRVRDTYHQNALPPCDIGFCQFARKAPRPQLLVSNHLRSPTALTEGGQPIVILPAKLVPTLADDELDGVIAHELGHFVLRRNRWCSTTLLRRLVFISPAAALVSAQLNREEEKACDDIAVSVIGRADVYAQTLVKSYRFAQGKPGQIRRFTQPLPQLLGYKAQLSTRVERLVQSSPMSLDTRFQYMLACCLWFGLIIVFFSG